MMMYDYFNTFYRIRRRVKPAQLKSNAVVWDYDVVLTNFMGPTTAGCLLGLSVGCFYTTFFCEGIKPRDGPGRLCRDLTCHVDTCVTLLVVCHVAQIWMVRW